MKKLMIALGAAALCGAVFAEDITSANIVGYANVQTEKVGINSMAQAFDAIANSGFNLVDIKPVINTELEEMYTGGVVIMTLTDGGATDQTYIWTLEEDAGDGEGEGWFDDQGVRITDKVFLPGEGFVVSTDFETSKLVTAGQVAVEDTVFNLITGINSCGNTMSASFKLGDIEAGVGVDENGDMLLVNEESGEELYTGGIVIMTLTDGGATDQTYIYTLEEDAADGEGAGWFNDQGERCDDSVTFDAGIGFVVSSDFVGGCIRIPSAL